MKKLYFTSLLAMMVAPAVAAPTHTSSTFPSNGVMEEDYTYQNQATVTNLKVSEGTATTTANYANCPTAFPNSDEGAESTDECYTACTVSDLSDAHAATASGKNYYGANETDTCTVASCENGYTLTTPPDLATIIGNTLTDQYGGISDAGRYTGRATQATLGITTNNTWAVNFGSDKGIVTGSARCSTKGGTPYSGSNFDPETVTLSDDVPEEFGIGYNCWCKIDGYKDPYGGPKQNIYGVPWTYVTDGNAYAQWHDVSSCQSTCARFCSDMLSSSIVVYRAPLYRALASASQACYGNTISITWANADAADVTANHAGQCVYGGDINTPVKAQHIDGKFFTGWTFNAQ